MEDSEMSDLGANSSVVNLESDKLSIINEASSSEEPDSEVAEADPGESECSNGSPRQQSTCIQVLSDGHSTLKANLQCAEFELSEKEAFLRYLEEDEVRQQERTWLLEDRIRLMNEKLCCYKRCLERKEKKQDAVLMELSEAKWKMQETKKFLEKLKIDHAKMQSKRQQRKEELAVLDTEDTCKNLKELQEDVIRLTNYKQQLEGGDIQSCAILNGNKMMELEQRKRALRDAIDERSASFESIYVELDEKEDRIQRLKKSLEDSKKQHENALRDRKNHCVYLAETELRLQRSLEYLRSKIDYGTYKPAPWPNLRESLKFKM